MRGKLWFAVGAAAGYVLGSRAGREKYEQIALTARKFWDHPSVQEAAGVVQAQATRLYEEGKGTVNDKLTHSKLGEKLSHGADKPLATAGSRSGGSTTSTTGAPSTGNRSSGTGIGTSNNPR
ncbi:hypothetical protein [Pilimelia columellifera]|uniref:YtxH domain-containing protein n=1 Tax=Pilimelia columellifera subsp. columellifera TaxID=706583 RepID=A0ABN3N554_9ACTN